MRLRLTYLALFSFILSACTTPSLKLSEGDRAKIQEELKSSDKSIALLIEEYQTKMLSFGPYSFELYAPGNYQLAQSKYQQAKTLSEDSQPSRSEEAKFAILGAHHLLDNALQQRAAVKLHLNKADAHFTELQKIEAPTLLPERFEIVSQSFTNLISMLERGNIQEAIAEQAKLIEQMIELEILSLKKKHLAQSKAYLAKSAKNNAKDYIRDRFNQVENLINETESFIDKNYRDRKRIQSKSVVAYKEAKQIYFISTEIETLLSSEDSELGRKVSDRFAFFDKITEALNIEPVSYAHYPEMAADLLNKLDSYVSHKPVPLSPKAEEKPNQNESNPTIEASQLKEKTIDSTVISTETNKAVLPELLNNSDTPSQHSDEESMEFDSIEYVE